jgi:hypothetical protein
MRTVRTQKISDENICQDIDGTTMAMISFRATAELLT